MTGLLIAAVLFLAYTNGANDNFKGVATLFGTGTASYRRSLALATVSTFAGSVLSMALAAALVKNFSGKGLIPDQFLTAETFTAVAVGASLAVFFATRIGMPVSTTHALVGGLVGVGVSSAGTVNLAKLGGTFFLPLVISPLLSATASVLVAPIFAFAKGRHVAAPAACICTQEVWTLSGAAGSATAAETRFMVGNEPACRTAGAKILGSASASGFLDGAHYFSASAVSFARGLNDTPKIAGLIFLSETLPVRYGMLFLALSIAAGGLLNARRVAETMSKKITSLTREQGLAANLVTAVLVGTASWNGLPVSTTHVSVGALFGIGTASRSGNLKTIGEIFLAWFFTLPIAALLAAGVSVLIKLPAWG